MKDLWTLLKSIVKAHLMYKVAELERQKWMKEWEEQQEV